MIYSIGHLRIFCFKHMSAVMQRLILDQIPGQHSEYIVVHGVASVTLIYIMSTSNHAKASISAPTILYHLPPQHATKFYSTKSMHYI